MKISTYIFLSFLIILILFSITTAIHFRVSEAVTENSRYVTRSTEITKQSGRFQRNILNMVSGLRGYLITGEKYFVVAFDSADMENQVILSELSMLVEDTAQIRLLGEIKTINQKWLDVYADPLKEAKEASIINDSNLMAFNKLYRNKFLTGNEKQIQADLHRKFKEFSGYEYRLRTERNEKMASYISTTGAVSIVLTISSIVLGLVIVIFLIRRITGRIDKMVKMADSISSGNYEVKMQHKEKDELSALESSLNHMAASLAQNIYELESKNRELDQFAHIVSHDLKGPLRGIDNVLSWIDEDHTNELTPKISDYLKTIKGRVNRAENLINGILSYARTDSETIAKEHVDLNALVNEVLLNAPLPDGMRIEVQTLPVIYTERVPVFQVFANLIGNAIKYNDKEAGVIRVWFKENQRNYEFSISDNGPGILKHYHKKIFVIFQTLKERDSFESNGVGLAIVKKILDARKENIVVSSEPGAGATFTFTWSKNN